MAHLPLEPSTLCAVIQCKSSYHAASMLVLSPENVPTLAGSPHVSHCVSVAESHTVTSGLKSSEISFYAV